MPITPSTCDFMSVCLHSAVSEGGFDSRNITFSFFFSCSRISDDHKACPATVYICKKPDFNKHKYSLF